ncbi:hypothetical protein NCER_102221, partial [Vairimorpha ceranae BRL01]
MLTLYFFAVGCNLFVNQEFANFLNEKLDIKDALLKNITDEKISKESINTTESSKKPNSVKLASEEGSQVEKSENKESKEESNEKSEGGQKNEESDIKTENVLIQPMQVKGREAVLVKSEDGEGKPHIIVLADQELMKNEEELKKLPAAIGGHEGENIGKEETKEGGSQQKSSEQQKGGSQQKSSEQQKGVEQQQPGAQQKGGTQQKGDAQQKGGAQQKG